MTRSAARITPDGYTVAMRITFSSLRYRAQQAQTWGITVFRN